MIYDVGSVDGNEEVPEVVALIPQDAPVNTFIYNYRSLINVIMVKDKPSNVFFYYFGLASAAFHVAYSWFIVFSFIAVIYGDTMFWKLVLPSVEDNKYADVINFVYVLGYMLWCIYMIATSRSMGCVDGRFRMYIDYIARKNTPLKVSFCNTCKIRTLELFYVNFWCSLLTVAGHTGNIRDIIFPIFNLVISYACPTAYFPVQTENEVIYCGSFFSYSMEYQPNDIYETLKMGIVDLLTNWFVIVIGSWRSLMTVVGFFIACIICVLSCGYCKREPTPEELQEMQHPPGWSGNNDI